VLRVREDHLEKFPDVLPDLDDVALEMWLREADDELKKLSDETWRTRVGSWMSLVDSLGEQASTKILGDLAATRGDFEVLQTAHKDICWVNHFQEIDDSKLYSIQQNCELFLKHYKGWFRWLSGTYKRARMIVSEHAAALNAELSGKSATRILTHCEHFLRLRQKRESMRNALSPLGVEVEPLPLHPAKLFDFCSVYLEHLQGADAIRATLERSRAKSQLKESVKGNSTEALQPLLVRLQQTCRRAELDRASLQALLTLKIF
jgi:hypothetical protein